MAFFCYDLYPPDTDISIQKSGEGINVPPLTPNSEISSAYIHGFGLASSNLVQGQPTFIADFNTFLRFMKEIDTMKN